MSEKPGHITVVGSTNVDLVVQVERFPQPGETLAASAYSIGPGGKGANQALAAARAGGEVSFVGAVGEDEHARVAVELMRRAGVDLSRVNTRSDVPTGTAHIAVDAQGENTIVVAAGANATMDADAVAQLGPLSGVVVVQGEIPRAGIEAACRQAVEGGAHFVVNLAPVIDVDEQVVQNADPLVANEHEICLLAQMLGLSATDRDAAVEALLGHGVNSIVVTLGGSGSLVARADGSRERVATPSVQAVDTTGAGDAFTGALATALARGEDLLDAVRFATRFAAATVTKAGAQSSYPTDLEELSSLPR